jgi:hypothetical protein
MRTDLENLISYLKKEKAISVNEMCEKLGMDRHLFYNTRRTATDGRKKELYNKLFEVYKSELENYGKDNTQIDNSDLQAKYLRLLENQNIILEQQRELLKRERDQLEATLLEKIKMLEDKLRDINH